MSSGQQFVTSPLPVPNRQSWYAIHVRARHEKRVAAELQRRTFKTFLPLVTECHDWSDRRKIVELPLFSCYVFVAIEPEAQERLEVLRIPGVLGFVGSNHLPLPISDSEIDNIRTVLASAVNFSEHPFLKVGERVRVRKGVLRGLEGILTRRKGRRALVVSIEAIGRSLIVEIESHAVEPL